MLILTTFPKGCTHFYWQGFSFWWLYFELFWGENKLTLLYKLHTDYFSLCQSVILSVLSHEEIYLNICRNVRGVLTFVIHYIYIYIWEWSSGQSFKHIGLDNKDTFCLYNFIKILSRFLTRVLVLGWNYEMNLPKLSWAFSDLS